jgi:CP family cyanate transporter-like MFS transporter
VPQIAPIFAGTILLGIGIAVANVLIPGIIKRDFDNPGPMMGAYAMALNGGAAVGAAFTVPIENATGSWRWALAAWGIPPAVAAIAWAPRAVRAVRDIGAGDGPRISLWRDRTAWMLSAFFACQAATFYGVVAWVPDVLRDAGYSSASAGVLLALVLLFGLPSSAFVPVVAARMRDQWPLAVATGVVWLIGLVGLLLSPGTAPALWMIAMGLAQGAGISLALTLVVLRAPDGAHASVLSGMVQGFGYTVGALGPLVVGVLHDASGGWELSLVLLIVVACALLAFAVAAARPRLVGIGH